MFCILLYVLSRSDSVPSRSATCSVKRYVFLIRSVTFRSSSFTFFHIFRQVIQNMYTFRHVPCNSYTKTWKMLFCKDLATKSGQIGRRTRCGCISYPHPKESHMICVWEKPSWGRGQLDFSHLLPTAQWCKVCGRENTSSCHWRWWGQTTVIWAHPSRAIHFITFWSRSGYVPSRSKHWVHFWILGHAFSYNCMRSHAFRATLLVNMKRWSRIPLSFRWVRLRSFTFRHAFPNSHSLFPYVPSRSHYVLSRSVRDVFCFYVFSIRSFTFLATLLVNMNRWSRIPLSFRWVRLRSFTFRHAFPNSHSLFPYVPSRSHYVLSRSAMLSPTPTRCFLTFLHVPITFFHVPSETYSVFMFFLYVPSRSWQPYW